VGLVKFGVVLPPLAPVIADASLVDVRITPLSVCGGFSSLSASVLRVILVLALSLRLWPERDTCELVEVV
jgi:hypothetical protein